MTVGVMDGMVVPVDVLVNGTTVLTGATCTGAFTAASFNAGSGDFFELVFTLGILEVILVKSDGT